MSRYNSFGAKIVCWHPGEIAYCGLTGGLVEIVEPSRSQYGDHPRFMVRSGDRTIAASAAYLYKRYALNPHIDYSDDNDSDFEYWKRCQEKQT